MRNTLILLFLFFFQVSWTQLNWNSGFKLSLLATVGSHQSSIGLSFNVFTGFEYAQLNAGTRFRLNGNDLGNRTNFHEWRHELGALVLWGKSDNPIQFEYSSVLHQQRTRYSLGYAYLWYVDNKQTSQRSGVWSLGVRRVDIQFENDVFGGQRKDRFRTGNIAVSYRDSINKATIAVQLWTGETANSKWDKTPREKDPSGYRDLTPLPYGKLNHGILYVEYKRNFLDKNYVGGRIGWDSEQIRHLVQNRFTHDLILLPKSVERNTPHYPRLNAQGENVFSRKEIRPGKFYFSTFLNDGGLY